jgi:hypothetical protein
MVAVGGIAYVLLFRKIKADEYMKSEYRGNELYT